MTTTTTVQPLTVLVLDDERAICRSLERCLVRRGYRVESVLSVSAALDLLDRGCHVDLVLADLMMPGVSGMEFIRIAAERWPSLPVVVITGYASVASAVEATRLGAVDYLAKPFTPAELEMTVARALALGTWKRPAAPEPARPEARCGERAAKVGSDAEADDPIDVDLPFSAREVAEVTGDAYVRALGRGDLPVTGRWPTGGSGRRRVLAVDDEPVVVNAIRKSLDGRGFRVDEAFTGYAALSRVASQPYDLVLLDMRMPDLDGLDVLPKIHQHQPGVPVVIVTGYASIETAVEAIQKGAADYLAKPFTPDELRRTADRLLQQPA